MTEYMRFTLAEANNSSTTGWTFDSGWWWCSRGWWAWFRREATGERS